MPLNSHTYFSFRFGAMNVQELLEQARKKGLRKIALTDVNNTSAILDFVRLAPAYGIEPVAGIDFRNGSKQEFIGIALNNEGFFELNRFLSKCSISGQTIVPKEAPAFSNVIIIYPVSKIPARPLRENEFIGVRASEVARMAFSDWKNNSSKLVALCPCTFRNKRDFSTHRLLRAIDNNTLLSKLLPAECSTESDVLRSMEEMLEIFYMMPHLVHNAFALLDECKMSFEFHTNKNKVAYTGSKNADTQLLRDECMRGLHYRFGNSPSKEILLRAEKELQMIADFGFCSYFLINWDIVRYARSKNYFYVGRGSGANSIVAYCLRITDVDPVELDLYFERFINPYRKNPPDFDLDFSWKDRDDITRYIFDRHGKDHTALLATYSTFQANAVIRELGKVFGLPKEEIDLLAEEKRARGTPDNVVQAILKFSNYIHDFPNHLSIHAGGILISEKPIHYYTATNMPPKGYPLTQFSMLEAEDIGLYKFDILSQRGLGHIREGVEIIRENHGVNIDIHDIKKFKKDEKISELIYTGKCMGCFYVESPGMRMLLKKLKARDYITLVAASSIIRPGVASSGMMREYILRFNDSEQKYKTSVPPKILELMKETYGVMVYQEDVIKVAHFFAGLSLGEADMLRRGMSGKFRSRDEFAKLREKFISNCIEKGYAPEVAYEVWRQIESFGGYSFSKGHSASYAVESFQSLYLKAYFPIDFMVGVINNFGGFYKTEYYVHEARMAGGKIMAPCVNKSSSATCIYGKEIFLGFAHMAEFEQKSVELLLTERASGGVFLDLFDFMKRVRISAEQLRLLIRVGAFRFTGKSKKELMWEIYTSPELEKKNLHAGAELFPVEPLEFKLPELDHGKYDDAIDEIEILGFPLQSPFSLLKNPEQFPLNAEDLPGLLGQIIEIAGYFVTVKHSTTKNGQAMMFGTFLDSKGYFFDTVHFPKVAAQFPFRGKAIYKIKASVAVEFDYYSLDVMEMEKVIYDLAV